MIFRDRRPYGNCQTDGRATDRQTDKTPSEAY